MEYAPIVLFIYNRPEHTKRTLKSLQKCWLSEKSELYIYADGPRDNSPETELKKIKEVKEVAYSEQWCKNVKVIERRVNLGLAQSIMQGVTEVIKKCGKIIVLEDDLELSKGFLEYMNNGLNMYEHDKKVFHISGYFSPIKNKLPETFFYAGASSWGWGTWQHAWEKFIPDAQEIKTRLGDTELFEYFEVHKATGFNNDLESNINGKIQTWCIKWHGSIVLNKGIGLYPNTSLVKNIGFDNSGENCGNNSQYEKQKIADKINVRRIPIEESKEAREVIIKFCISQSRISFLTKVMIKSKIILNTLKRH